MKPRRSLPLSYALIPVFVSLLVAIWFLSRPTMVGSQAITSTENASPGKTHIQYTSAEQVTIDFTRTVDVPLIHRVPVRRVLTTNLEHIPIASHFTVTASRIVDGWTEYVIVPTYVIESNWDNFVEDEIIKIVVHEVHDSGEIDSYLIQPSGKQPLPTNIPSAFFPKPLIPNTTYKFPWTNGQYWKKTNGWHPNDAIDFAPTSGASWNVLAAGSGYASIICNDGYQVTFSISNSDGNTRYLHLDAASAQTQLNGTQLSGGETLSTLYNGTAKVNGACDPAVYLNLQWNTTCGCGTARHLHFGAPNRSITIDGFSIENVAASPNETWYQSTNSGGGGCSNPNADQVTLYVRSGFDSNGQCVTKGIGEYSNSGSIGLPDNSIRSIKVGSNVRARLCTEENFGGNCDWFGADNGDLNGSAVGSGTSSVKVESKPPEGCSNPNADQVTLYVRSGFDSNGQCVTKGIGEYSNSGSIGLPDNSIRSIKVGSNVRARLCTEENFGGNCDWFGADNGDLNGSAVGYGTSSVKVETRPPQDTTPPQVTWLEPVATGGTQSVYGQPVRLKVSATDNVGVAKVKFDWWNATAQTRVIIAEDNSSPYEVDFNTNLLNSGCNLVNAGATDTSGNFFETYISLCLYTPQTPTLNTINNADGDGVYTVTWSDTINAPAFELQQRLYEGDWFTVYNGPGKSQNFNRGAGVWCYRVRATNNAGTSAWSALQCTTVNLLAPSINNIENADSDGNFTVSWLEVSGAVGYDLQEKLNSGSWQNVANISGTSKSFTGKAAGTWCFRARGWNENMPSISGPWSQEKCTTVEASSPLPPTLQTPTNGKIFVEGETIALSWDSSANATGYYGAVLDGPAPIAFGWQSALEKNLGALTPGYRYSWKVKARNDGGESAYSAIRTFDVVPAAPSNLLATAQSCTSVQLTWSDNSIAEDGFKIYRNGTEVGFVGTSGTSYTDGVQPEQSYTYTVKAHRNGFFSNAGSASVTTPDCSVPPPAPPVLVSPSNNAKIVEGESIVLTWNSVTNATGYFGNITGGPAPLTFGWQTGISKNIGSQSPGYEYLWEVKARNGSVEGNFSNKWVFIVIPKAPSNLSASLQSCSSVNLTWTDNSGSEDGYKIYRNGTEVGLVGAGGSSYTDQGLQEQTSYSYVVRAHRNGLHSNPSNSASITTSSCNGDTTAPQVVWVEPVGDTESYNVSGETVTLKVNATDNVAVDYVIFSRWDHPTQQAIEISTDFQAPYTAQVDTSEFTNDWNEVRAQAIDSAGNESDSPYIWLYYEPDDGSLGTPPINSIDNADGDGNYTVDWPQIDDATGYRLQEQHDSGSWSQVYNGPNTSVDRANRSNGEWCYRVRAYNDSVQSDWSAEECVTVNPDIEPPLAPVLDSISNPAQQSAYWVTWTTVNNVESYELQERYSGEPFTEIYSGMNTSQYRFGRGEGQWCYRVRANGPGGLSDWSQTQCTTVSLETGDHRSFIPMVTD